MDSVKTKMGGLLLQKDLQILRDALNPEEFGGALLVGMNAPVVIAHGNSKARGIAQAVRMGRRGARQRPAPDDRPGAWDADRLGVDSPKLARRFTA